jgi:hypothetical protein
VIGIPRIFEREGSVSGTPSLVLATVDGEAGELTVSG